MLFSTQMLAAKPFNFNIEYVKMLGTLGVAVVKQKLLLSRIVCKKCSIFLEIYQYLDVMRFIQSYNSPQKLYDSPRPRARFGLRL